MAVLDRKNGKDILVYSNCIETTSQNEFPERLAHVANECAILIKKFSPDMVAVEKLYFSANKKTAMLVSEVRGALLNTAQSRGIPTFEYSPSEIKSATTSSGNADKTQVAKMLHSLIKIEKEIEHDDEYDAIAVGITAIAHHRY